MFSLGQKLKCLKQCEKHINKHTRVVLCKKTTGQNTKYSRNETILKIGHLAKAIALQRLQPLQNGQFGSKIKMSQNIKRNVCISTLELFCAKIRWKKHQIFDKWDDVENRPSCKGYSPCKGYSLCKIVSLGQKLKYIKTCEKHIYNHTRLFLCKKTAEKNTKYSRNEVILKIGHLAKAMPMQRL